MKHLSVFQRIIILKICIAVIVQTDTTRLNAIKNMQQVIYDINSMKESDLDLIIKLLMKEIIMEVAAVDLEEVITRITLIDRNNMVEIATTMLG